MLRLCRCGCGQEVGRGKHFVRGHNSRLNPNIPPVPIGGFLNKGKKCIEDGCDAEAYCRQLCVMHYQRRRKAGIVKY